MSQLPPDGTILVKPQSNVYTLMMIITILVLGFAAGFVVHKMMLPLGEGGYGMTFGEIFSSPAK